jgi:tetratricopeptide (TPR) repeat protein
MLQRLIQWIRTLSIARISASGESEVVAKAQLGNLGKETFTSVLAYDENLLERSRTQWQFGDWASLGALDRETLQHHPDRAKLAILAAAGHAQQGASQTARQLVRLAQQWGCPQNIVAGVMVAGVYNHIGRASALFGDQPRSLRHFEAAVALGSPQSDHRLLARGRVQEQEAQLQYLLQNGSNVLEQTKNSALDEANANQASDHALLAGENPSQLTESIIEGALLRHPAEPALLIAHAEAAMSSGQYDEAIRRWQNMAAILGDGMLTPYYDRLYYAYQNIKSFPKGSAEEEHIYGKGDKHQLLEIVHRELNPRLYLEIGVQTGKSLRLAIGQAIGVDPMPQITQTLDQNIRLIKATSDAFFSDFASEMLREGVDMAFIDGMHLFEYVLRDFINVEKYSKPGALIFIDDIYPGHAAQAKRERVTRAWTGDVWKILPILKKYRPDLTLLKIDIRPTGLLVVCGMDASNTVLSNNYKKIVEEYKDDTSVPFEILSRTSAISGDDPQLPAELHAMVRHRFQI